RLGCVATGGVGQIAFLVAIRLEIGLVPAAAGQPERRRAHPPPQLRRGARRTNRGIAVGQLLQPIEAMATGVAFKFVDGHGYSVVSGRLAVGTNALSVCSGRFQCSAARSVPTGAGPGMDPPARGIGGVVDAYADTGTGCQRRGNLGAGSVLTVTGWV